MTWTDEMCEKFIDRYDSLTSDQKQHLISILDSKFPPEVYDIHKSRRHKAFENETRSRRMLDGAVQFYPELICVGESPGPEALKGCAVVLTAGGEGERLRLSLQDLGYSGEDLKDFTKATFKLPDFHKDFGALQTNIALFASICRQTGIDIPVVVTTGPKGSTTDRLIPDALAKHGNFGLKNLLVTAQEERLHLTADDKIAWRSAAGIIEPVTHPDETGGPLMSLKQPLAGRGRTPLEHLSDPGVEKILVLQATALYNPALVYALAGTDNRFDFIGAGILRESFEKDDPYGTYVGIETNGGRNVAIIEQAIRNDTTRTLKNSAGTHFLPYNTGFYAFDITLLKNADLPDYATPPKEILPELERTPKVGYAATDLITLAERPAVLAVEPDWFAVIKRAEDLETLAKLGRLHGLDRVCSEV